MGPGGRRGQVAADARALAPLVAAGVLGSVHGVVSLYWAAGGDWLLATLGTTIVETFADLRWVLYPVAILKIGFAWAPYLLARRGWADGPAGGRAAYGLCWLGAAVLIAWGGLNTFVGNLVLGGLIRPDDGYEREAMIGHAWLWDPLFLGWGVALVVGLLHTRRSR